MKVHPTDCKILKTLWRKSNNETVSVMGRLVLVAESSQTTVNYAMQQVRRDYRDDNEMVTKLINRNFYEDDFVKSVSSEEECTKAYENNGFQLRKRICKSEKEMEARSLED